MGEKEGVGKRELAFSLASARGAHSAKFSLGGRLERRFYWPADAKGPGNALGKDRVWCGPEKGGT
jgi:hypothetical protein